MPEDYEVPLQGMVPPDPTFEDMRRVVVVERRQPAIPPRWNTDSEEVYTVHVCVYTCMYYVCMIGIGQLSVYTHMFVCSILQCHTYMYMHVHTSTPKYSHVYSITTPPESVYTFFVTLIHLYIIILVR